MVQLDILCHIQHTCNLEFDLYFLYSHDILFEPPEGIDIIASKNSITVSGYDKQVVGEVSAKIRSFKKPEPYKGKGIRYKDEHVRRKQGKTVGGVG